MTVPKCACETVRAWFFRAYPPRSTSATVGLHALAASEGRPLPPLRARRLAVVRDPYRRLVSAYFNKIANPADATFYVAGMSFGDFVAELHSNRADARRWNGHWRPSSAFCVVPPHVVAKVATLQRDLDAFGTSIGVGHQDVVNRKRTERRYAGDAMDYYDADLIDMVNAIYAEDFRRFNFVMIAGHRPPPEVDLAAAQRRRVAYFSAALSVGGVRAVARAIRRRIAPSP